MLKSLIKITGLVAGLVFSGAVFALGMGGINVTSALGQPLSAEIDLVSVSKSEKESLSAKLASSDAFQMAGIDYPYSLPKITFKIKTRKDGSTYVTLTTQDPVNDPFVNLLVELDWATGKLMREYTFLLDPPGYKLEQPKPEAVQPVEPAAPAPAPVPQAPAKPQAVPLTKAAPAPAPAPVAQKAPVVAKPAPANVATGTITVKRGDTLSKIAAQIKEPDVTLEQMLVALYRANANQFDGKNMNRIRAGKILRRPAESDLAHLSNTEAIKVIHAQAADWHAYRQKLAAASSTMSEQAPQQEVSGKVSTSVSDKTPSAKASAKEVLRLSKGEAPGDKIAAAGGNNVQALQNKIHSLEEEAVARKQELQDSKQRIAMLEKNIKEMQHLVDLKAPQAPAGKPAEAKPASKPESAKIVPPAASAAVAAGTQKAAQPAAKSQQPVAKPKPKPKHKAAPKLVPPPPPPSLLDEVLGNPLYLGGIAVAVLALGGLGFYAVRRRGTGGKQKDIQGALAEQAEEPGHISEPIMPSPDTGDFTHMEGDEEEAFGDEAGEPSAGGEEEVDPISEAELFLNFGRYAQAEEVLKEALSREPNNLKYLLKLLGIYANEKDVNAFSSFARRVQDSGDAEAWEKVAAMGRDIDPGNPMYGGTGAAEASEAAAPEAAVEAGTATGADEVGAVTDFVLDEGKNEEPSALDFDLGMGAPETTEPETGSEAQETAGNESTTILSQEEMRAAQEAPMDFDITSTNPSMQAAEPETAAAETPEDVDLGLDFDITSTNPSMQAVEPEENATIDITAEEEKPADSGLDLNDLIFDVTGSSPAAETAEAESTTAKQAAPMDIGLGDISLNLDAGESEQAAAETPVAGDKDEHWHEVATKLDLAKAYQEMGDADGAREILQEVVREGDEQQRASAQALIDQLA